MTVRLPAAYRAAWIFPVSSAPVRHGVIELDVAGQIVAIRSGSDRDAIDLGEVAVVPATVNAHAHLEFSDLAAPVGPPRPFPTWIRNVVAHRRARTEPVDALIRRGFDEVARTGTALVGEIATSDDARAYRDPGPDAVVFRELIGPLPESWPAVLAAAEGALDGTSGTLESDGIQSVGFLRGRIVPGLSTHAPYTVPQQLYERLVDLAARRHAPVAVHLAETAAELDLLATGTGELVDMMRSLGLWRADLHPPGRRPLDWLNALASAPRGLVVHGNFLADDELDFLAANENLSLAFCPRTHAYFGHPPHPFRRLLERGGRVALGTDGRSSNPDVDLWREAVFLRARHPGLPSDTILELATRRGSAALGAEDRHGSLAPGRAANFLAIRLPGPSDDRPPDLFVPGCDVVRVFRGGIELDCHDGGPACPD